jgi:E3 ubiquitin-protein ligase DMA1/2
VWHYKCIRPILNGSTYPNLTCPNCRAAHDLEADIEEEEESYSEDEAELQEAIEASKKPTSSTTHILPTNSTASALPEQPRLSMDVDGDSHMQDIMTDGASAPAPQRPPPPPPIPVQQPPPSVAIQGIESLQFDTQPGATATSNNPSTSLPRNIPSRVPVNGRFEPHFRPNGTVNDVSLTPRNDAGPFVLDGSAGRNSTNAPTTNGVNRPRLGSHLSLSHEEGDRS